MNFSVIICTRNRAEVLPVLLESLFRSIRLCEDHVEVVVVNNSSTDNTANVLRQLSDTLDLNCLVEKQPGLSNARNCGWRAANYEHCVFLDDDCVIPETWVKAWVDGFRNFPDATFFGGPIIASFESRCPGWVDKENYGFLFGHFDPGCPEGPTEVLPWGGNMGITRSFLEKAGGFDPSLGLNGKRMLAGEETVLFEQAIAEGLFGVFLPAAHLQHRNVGLRLSLSHARKRCIGQGRTMAIQTRRTSREALSPFTFTKNRFRENVTGAFKCWVLRPSLLTFGRLLFQLSLAQGHFLELARPSVQD